MLLSKRLQGPAHLDRLDVAATRDPALHDALHTLTVHSRTESLHTLRERIRRIVIRWTEAENADPKGRGPAIDGRHLAAVEAWTGKPVPRNGEWGRDPTPVQAAYYEGHFQDIVDWTARRLLTDVVETEEVLRLMREGETIASEGRMWSHRLVITGYLRETTDDSLPSEVRNANQAAALRDAVMFLRGAREATPETAVTLEEVKLFLRLQQVGLKEPDLRYAQALLPVYGIDESETAQAVEWITTPHMSRIDGTEGDDHIEGGLLNDVMSGEGGNDTYVWGPGRGNDVVSEVRRGGGSDTLVIRDAGPEEIEVRYVDKPGHKHDRQFMARSTGDWVIIFGQAKPRSARVEIVRFDDGTIWDAEAIEARARKQ